MEDNNADPKFSGASPADAELVECFAAFAARDYHACVGKAMQAFSRIDHPMLNHLIAICLQRLDQMENFDQLPRLMLDTAASPWDWSLVKLTFGQADLETVLQTAQTDVQRCQANYYGGARLLTLGHTDVALKRFEICVKLNVDCLEKRLAEIERDALLSKP